MNWYFRFLSWLRQYQTGKFVLWKQCYYCANMGTFFFKDLKMDFFAPPPPKKILFGLKLRGCINFRSYTKKTLIPTRIRNAFWVTIYCNMIGWFQKQIKHFIVLYTFTELMAHSWVSILCKNIFFKYYIYSETSLRKRAIMAYPSNAWAIIPTHNLFWELYQMNSLSTDMLP